MTPEAAAVARKLVADVVLALGVVVAEDRRERAVPIVAAYLAKEGARGAGEVLDLARAEREKAA